MVASHHEVSCKELSWFRDIYKSIWFSPDFLITSTRMFARKWHFMIDSLNCKSKRCDKLLQVSFTSLVTAHIHK